MTTPTTVQRLTVAAVFAMTALLLVVLPAGAHAQGAPPQPHDEESLDGWVSGRARSTHQPGVDAWAVGEAERTQQLSVVDAWAVGRRASAPPVVRADDSWAPTQLLLGGLLAAALLGMGAAALSHRRHTPAAH